MGFLGWAKSVINEGREPEVHEETKSALPVPQELYFVDYEFGVSDQLFKAYRQQLEEMKSISSRALLTQEAQARKSLGNIVSSLVHIDGSTTLDEADSQRKRLEELVTQFYKANQELGKYRTELLEKFQDFRPEHQWLVHKVANQFPPQDSIEYAVKVLAQNTELRKEVRGLVPEAGQLTLAELAPKLLNHHNRLLVEAKVSHQGRALERYHNSVKKSETEFQIAAQSLSEYGVEIENFIAQQNHQAERRQFDYNYEY